VEAYVLYGLRVSEYAALLDVVYIWVLRTFSWSLEVYGNTTSVMQFLFEHSLRHKPVAMQQVMLCKCLMIFIIQTFKPAAHESYLLSKKLLVPVSSADSSPCAGTFC
jgi:hypothetical protein